MPLLSTQDQDPDRPSVVIAGPRGLDLVLYQDDLDDGLLDDHAELGRMFAAFVRECVAAAAERQATSLADAPYLGSH